MTVAVDVSVEGDDVGSFEGCCEGVGVGVGVGVLVGSEECVASGSGERGWSLDGDTWTGAAGSPTLPPAIAKAPSDRATARTPPNTTQSAILVRPVMPVRVASVQLRRG